MNTGGATPVRLYLAWVIALGSTLSVLFIGEVLGQTPCVLCWFQRAFMFPLAVVLGIAVWRNDLAIRVYALPLAFVGASIALWHLGIYVGLIPEVVQPCAATGPSCAGESMKVLGLPLPLLSLIAFAAIAGLLHKTTLTERSP